MPNGLLASMTLVHALHFAGHDTAARHPRQGLADLFMEYVTVRYGAFERPEHILYVSVHRQRMYHLHRGMLGQEYVISTATNGLGHERDSYRTPTGLHRVAEKHGEGVPLAGILKDRGYTGEVADLEQPDKAQDVITTRLLWLDGLESGINKGGTVDSYDRMIYIHGTGDESCLGRPASRGCVRMSNQDVLDLFDRIPVGSWVVILDD